MVKLRKKEKVLEGYEEEMVEKYCGASTKDSMDDSLYLQLGEDAEKDREVEQKRKMVIKPSATPVWTLRDFKDIVMMRELCAWGECNSKR
mmetsp:Transcript_7106/g.8993  ORF Transcript_7106/g.8993 Transcript_7106/m.8993 type:complete len:90 (+) Transcript_7106:2-271(+)